MAHLDWAMATRDSEENTAGDELIADFDYKRLSRDGEVLRLRQSSLPVLRALLDQAPEVVTKEALLKDAWPGVTVGDGVVKVSIRELRRQLGDDASDSVFIETLRGRGYRYIGNLEWIGASVARLSPRGAAFVPRRATAVEGRPDPRTTPTIVGRDAELDELERAFKEVLYGKPRLTLLVAPDGFGKTALLDAFAAKIAGVPRIARVSCRRNFGPEEPYSALLELFSDLARQLGVRGLSERLDGAAPSWLLQLPSLRATDAARRASTVMTAHTPPRLVFEATQALVVLAEERPLVVIVDDAHHVDSGTLDVLLSVARTRTRVRILIIAAVAPELREGALVSLMDSRRYQHVELGPLTEEAVAELLQRRYGRAMPAAVVERRWRESGGEPLALFSRLDESERETASAPVDHARDPTAKSPSEGVGEVFEIQLVRLEPRVRRVLQAAALIGLSFAPDTVAAALAEEPAWVADACATLARSQTFLRAERGRGGYTFLHAHHRATVLGGLDGDARGTLLRALSRAQGTSPDENGPDHRAIAGGLHECGELLAAIEHLREAAVHDLANFRLPQARSALDQALELCGELDPPALRLRLELLELLIELAINTYDAAATLRYQEDYLRSARHVGDLRGEMLILVMLGISQWWWGQGSISPEFLDGVEVAIEAARLAEDDVAIKLGEAVHASLEFCARGYAPGLEERIAHAHEITTKRSSLGAQVLAVHHGWVRIAVSDYEAAHVLARGLVREALRTRRSMDYHWGCGIDFIAQVRRGRWDDALRTLEHVEHFFEGMGLPPEVGAGTFSAYLLAEVGAWEDLAPVVDRTRAVLELLMANNSCLDGLLRALSVCALCARDEAELARAELAASSSDGLQAFTLHRDFAEALTAARFDGSEDRRRAVHLFYDRARAVGPGERHWMAMARVLEAELDLNEGATLHAWTCVDEALALVPTDEMWPTAARVLTTASRVARRLGDTGLTAELEARADAVINRLLAELKSRPRLQASYRAWSQTPFLAEV